MKCRASLVFLLVLVPLCAFGQTAQEKYREAKVAEYRSDHATSANERMAYINDAFGAITEAAASDPRHMDTFVAITRKYVARNKEQSRHIMYVANELKRVGAKGAGHPGFKKLVGEIVSAHKLLLARDGFVPGKPFVQTRKRLHCNVPYAAEHIYELSLFVQPAAAAASWGRYAADVYMKPRQGCGGEGGTQGPDPAMAFLIYTRIQYRPGMRVAGKMLGDEWMEKYVFGGSDEEEPYTYRKPGHRPFYDRATKFYQTGGVTRSEVRATALRYLRRAETEKNRLAEEIAEKALAGTF